MDKRESEQAADPTRIERRPRFTVARAVLLGALSIGSLVGAEAAASADPSVPIIGGYTATCEYTTSATTTPDDNPA